MAYRIAIVGCGVAGLTAALLLARQGNAVTLFEQSAAVGPVGAGILLQPSGQLVLERMGLLDRVVAQAQRVDRLYAVTHRRRLLVNLPYGAVSPRLHAYGLHRGELFSVLFAEATAAGVVVVTGARIVRFLNRANHVEVFDDGGKSRAAFDFLIGADGSCSALRGASGLSASIYEYPHGAFWVVGRCSAIGNELFQVTRGTRLLCGLLPLGQGRCCLFWSVDKPEKDALFARGLAAWRDDVRAIMPEAEEIVGGLTSFDAIPFTTYLRVRMRRWCADRFLLIGDAAHSMSPHLGQGINLALLDGLAIARAIGCSANPSEAFVAYERARRSHTDFYALVTSLLSPFFQSRGVIKGWGRDWVLPLLPRVPVVGSQMLLTMTGMKRSYFGGKIALPD